MQREPCASCYPHLQGVAVHLHLPQLQVQTAAAALHQYQENCQRLLLLLKVVVLLLLSVAPPPLLLMPLQQVQWLPPLLLLLLRLTHSLLLPLASPLQLPLPLLVLLPPPPPSPLLLPVVRQGVGSQQLRCHPPHLPLHPGQMVASCLPAGSAPAGASAQHINNNVWVSSTSRAHHLHVLPSTQAPMVTMDRHDTDTRKVQHHACVLVLQDSD